MNWPMLLVLALCGGIATANAIRLSIVATTLLAAAAFGAGLNASSGETRLLGVAVGLCLLGLGWGSLRLAALDRSYLEERIGEAASVRAVVTGPARRSRYAVRVPATVTRFGADQLTERVLLQLPPERAPPQGAVLELRARPVEPRGPETGFDERRWLARQGVHVVLDAWDANVVGRRGGIGGVADRLRGHVEQTLASGTSGEPRRLLIGVVLGEDEGLSDELRNRFKASGLTHLLAVSGQNVAITALGVVVVARVIGIGRIVGEALAIAAVLAYALAAGWQPSVVRAAVAGIVASMAWISGRPRDRWYAMALGALVLLAWTPTAFLEPGFQLSFVAVAAIFTLVPLMMRFWEGYPIPMGLAELMTIALVCGLATAPIVYLHFGALPVWTVPANMLAEPAMAPLVGCSLAAAAIAPLSPAAAASLAWLGGWCAAWIAGVARMFGGLPGAQLTSGPAVLLVGLSLVVGAILLRLPPYRRRAGVSAIVCATVVAATGWKLLGERPTWRPPTGLRVSFLDVGQGDSILVECPGGALLVDAGPPEARVASQLRKLGLRSLSAMLLTHPHRDHVGGAAEVLRRLSVAELLDPDLAMPSNEEASAKSVARERHVPIVDVREGDHFRLGRLRLDVLWPNGPGLPDGDPNTSAVVLVAHYGSTDVLLQADAESEVTRAFPLHRIEVLKVAHHGSTDTGLPELLARIHPRVAVISVGENNDYGHPRPETVAALEAAPGLSVYRTDENGRVVVESDGVALTVHSER
jgi:competence protein ComEC